MRSMKILRNDGKIAFFMDDLKSAKSIFDFLYFDGWKAYDFGENEMIVIGKVKEIKAVLIITADYKIKRKPAREEYKPLADILGEKK